MENGKLSQFELEDLSAWMDGELPAERAEQVEQLVRDDAAWREAHGELVRLNQAMDLPAVPAAAPDLAARIALSAPRAARRAATVSLVARLAAPLAAAAAIVLAVMLWHGHNARHIGPAQQPTGEPTELAKLPPKERQVVDDMIVENLDFFRDYQVVADYDTLEAIGRLEGQGM